MDTPAKRRLGLRRLDIQGVRRWKEAIEPTALLSLLAFSKATHVYSSFDRELPSGQELVGACDGAELQWEILGQ